MRRLREEVASDDKVRRRAGELVASLEPLPVSGLRMRRVHSALQQPTSYRKPGWLKPIAVIGVLCGGAATAGATWGVVRMVSPPVERPPIVVSDPPQAPRKSADPQRNQKAPLQPRDLEADPAAEPAPFPQAPDSAPQRPRPRPHRSSQPREPAPTRTTSRPTTPSDSILVHQAVRALRGQGNAEQASQLLERYRSKNPSGVLAEEALALAIEAALQNKDPKAQVLARQYLAQYPNGRFRAAARRAAR